MAKRGLGKGLGAFFGEEITKEEEYSVSTGQKKGESADLNDSSRKNSPDGNTKDPLILEKIK